MSKRQFNLETELTAKIDDLTSKLNQANRQVENYKRKQEQSGASLQNIYKGVAGAIGTISAAFVAVQGASAIFNNVINSTQNTADSFAVSLAGIKGGLDAIYESVARMDFSNLITNIQRAASARKDLARTEDLLGDVGRSASVKRAEYEREKEIQRNIYRDNSGTYSDEQRLAALAEAQRLSGEILLLEQKIAEELKTALKNDLAASPTFANSAYGNNTEVIDEFIEGYADAWQEGWLEAAGKLNDVLKDAPDGIILLIDKFIKGDILAEEFEKEFLRLTKSTVLTQPFRFNPNGEPTRYKDFENDDNIGQKQKQTFDQMHNQLELIAREYQGSFREVLKWSSFLRNIQSGDKKLDSYTNASVNVINAQKNIESENLEFLRERNRILGKDSALKTNIPMVQPIDIKINDDSWFAELERLELVEIEPVAIDFDLVGLPLMMQQLKELEDLQTFSTTSEQFQSYQQRITDLQGKIREFKGENEEYVESISGYYSELGNAFNSLADSMDRLGNDGLAAFFNAAAAISQTVEALSKLNETVTIFSTTKKAADAAEIATAPVKVAANQAVATSEAVKSSAGVPFPGNLLAIATSVAAIIAAFASIKRFETGGIIGGSSLTGDNLLIRANSGEMILNHSQQSRLFSMLNGTASTGSGQVTFRIDGKELVGVLTNYGKFNKLTR